jgi:hypothetical protein
MTPWDPGDQPDLTLGELLRAVPAAGVLVLLVFAFVVLTFVVGAGVGAVR